MPIAGFGKPVTSERLALDLAWLNREGLLEAGPSVVRFRHADQDQGAMRVTPLATGLRLEYHAGDSSHVDELVPYLTTPTPFGGSRTWLQCLSCGQGCRVLYSGPLFRCRRCHGLAYASQRDKGLGRAVARAQRLRERVGGSADLTQPFPLKPKRMFWRTYRRHERRDRELIAQVTAAFVSRRGAVLEG